MTRHLIGRVLALALAATAAASPATAQDQPVSPPAPWVRGVRLNISDMDRSIAFYRDLVGMKLVGVFGKGSDLEQAVFMQTGKINYHQTMLVIARDASVPGPIDPRAVGWVSVWVPSVDEATARVRAAGYTVTVEPVDAPREHLRRSYVKDPDGFAIEILNFVTD